MYVIKNDMAVSQNGICQVLTQRISELQLKNGDLTDIGEFILVEPGDTITYLEEESGCAIATDLFGENHYGDPGFVPSFEWLEHHQKQHCFEMVFITNDGFFTVLLIPDDPGFDNELLSLCREYSKLHKHHWHDALLRGLFFACNLRRDKSSCPIRLLQSQYLI
jgi:hypothetical protein